MHKYSIFIYCVIGSLLSYCIGFISGKKYTAKKVITNTIIQTDTIYAESNVDIYSIPEEFLLGDPKENLYQVLLFYGIKYPDIAYAIAIQETGWFKSNLCKKYNNLFGLYDSKHHRYRHYDNWYESVIAYRDLVEKKYKGKGSYLEYLEKLPYSTSKDYITKIRQIINQIKNKRKHE